MNNCFIILAAGNSTRFKSNISKPFINYKGKPILLHSIQKAKKTSKFKIILLVINKRDKKKIKKMKLDNIKIIEGGKSRAESSFKAIKYLKKYNISKVLIHDAARPNFSLNLVNKLLQNLKKNECVIPALKSTDSTKLKKKNNIFNLNRDEILLTQTPQAFQYKQLYNLQKNLNINATDDASLFIRNKQKIKFINGEEKNKKITFESDLNNNITKYGIGFDIHRLEKGRKLFLGGVAIPYHMGLKGHSDGDVIIHALIDSLLGACKLKDIGTLFSDKKKKYKNIRSHKMLNKVLNIINLKGFFINNIDINLISEKPKISKYRNKIISSLCDLCKINKEQINIKGKTVEKLGLIGKEKAIACEIISSVIKYD